MRMLVFSSRCGREILRDPLNLAFGLGFPLAVLLLLSMLQANIPEAVFPIGTLAPGIAVFGLSFISLFSGMLVAKDRGTSLLSRLYAAPLTAAQFIGGYILPLLPFSLAQSAFCFAAALCLGLAPSWNVLLALAVSLPAALLFIGLGLLAGSLLNDRQVGGVCGALLTNASAWLSGAWFDVSLAGGAYEKVAYALPFAHAVDAGRAALAGDFAGIFPHLWWVLGYAAAVMALAVFAFQYKMRRDTA